MGFACGTGGGNDGALKVASDDCMQMIKTGGEM